MVSNTSRVMNFQKVFLKALQASAPSVIHPCPYEGKYSLFNVSVPKGYIEILPIGTFRLNIRAFNKVDNNIITFVLDFEVFKV